MSTVVVAVETETEVSVDIWVVVCVTVVARAVVSTESTLEGTKSNPLGLSKVLLKGVILPVEGFRVPTKGLLLSLGSPMKIVPVGQPVVSKACIVPALASTT